MKHKMDYTIEDFLNTIDYKIGEGSNFMWSCFGQTAYQYTYTEYTKTGYGYDFEFNMVFDTETRIVYVVEFCVVEGDKVYKCFNPEFKEAYDIEEKIKSESLGFEPIEYEDYTGRTHEFKNLVNNYYNKIEIV